MSTITKERAKDILEFGTGRIISPITDHEIMEMARIALASLEAEPVITVGDDGGDALAYRRLIQTFAPGTKLYTAPPAPVSVPDEEQRKPHPVMAVKGELGFLDNFDRIISERDEDIDIGQLGSSNCEALMLAALDAFRAAMLQGADGNYPVIPDGYALVPIEPTSEMQSAAAGAIRFDTTPINKLWTGNAVYKAMIAAAPQQEVR